MTREEIEAGVAEVAAVHLPTVSDLRADARLVEDLGLDSFQILTLSFEIEDHFEITLDPEDEESIATVADLVDTIARLRGAEPDTD